MKTLIKKFILALVLVNFVLVPKNLYCQSSSQHWTTRWTNYLWYDGSGQAADPSTIRMSNTQWVLDPTDTAQIFSQGGKPLSWYFDGNVIDLMWYWEVKSSTSHDQWLAEMITPDSVVILASLRQVYHRDDISDSALTSRIAVNFANGNTGSSVSCTEYDLSFSKKKFVWTISNLDSTPLQQSTEMEIRIRIFGDTAYMGNDVEIYDLKLFKGGKLLLHDTFQPIITGVRGEVVPTEFMLYQNYPNPFNPTTNITFSLPKAGDVSLRVYNVIGQEVATLINGYLVAGSHEVQFNGSGLASGIYICSACGRSNIVKKNAVDKLAPFLSRQKHPTRVLFNYLDISFN